jgi:DNA-binding transcriptional LysR family regulator
MSANWKTTSARLLLNRTTRQFSLTEPATPITGRAVRDPQGNRQRCRTWCARAGRSQGPHQGVGAALHSPMQARSARSLIDFCAAHPDMIARNHLDDRFVDLVEEGYDVAIRITKA